VGSGLMILADDHCISSAAKFRKLNYGSFINAGINDWGWLFISPT